LNKKVLSVQSQIATGYVGNNIATLALQLHGIDPVAIPTVILSNHVEYEVFLGTETPPKLFSDLLKGIELNKILDECSYVITGFCNHTEQIEILKEYLQKNRHKYQFVYDPVFGDHRVGGLYISEAAARASAEKLLPLADIVIPNHFELEFLLNEKVNSLSHFNEKIASHSILKSKTIIATGMKLEDTAPDTLEILWYEKGNVKRFSTPELKIETLGTGDLFTAVVVGQLMQNKTTEEAIKKAIDYLHHALEYLIEKGYKEFNAETLLHVQYLL